MFFVLILSLFLFTQVVSAYEIQCNIDVNPHNFDEIVTTESIRVNVTLENIGTQTFPSSLVNVTTPVEFVFSKSTSLPIWPVAI